MRALYLPSFALILCTRALAQSSAPVDPELGLRLAEADAEVAALELRYGPRHPQLVEARRRLLYLREGAVQARTAGVAAAAGAELCGRLRQLAATLGAGRAELQTRYGAQHPRLVEIARRIGVVEQHLHAACGPASALARPPTAAELIVRRAEAEGRLGFLTARYRARHPAVVSTRTALDATRGALDAGGALGEADRAAARLRLIEALASARGRREALLATARDVGELDAVLDALAVHLAKLGATERTSSCACADAKPAARSGRRPRTQ